MPKQCCKYFFARIPDDVPVFTLVAYDKLAIRRIEEWIEEAKSMGVNDDKLKRSVEHLEDFKKFRADHPERMKLPD